MIVTLGTAAWNKKSVNIALPEFWADILIINKSAISGDLSNLKIILSPALSNTIIVRVSKFQNKIKCLFYNINSMK